MDPDDNFKINDRIPEAADPPPEAPTQEAAPQAEPAPVPAVDKNLAVPTKEFESANSAAVMQGRVGKTKKKLWFLLFLIFLIAIVAAIGLLVLDLRKN